jgi:hypothetical protein
MGEGRALYDDVAEDRWSFDHGLQEPPGETRDTSRPETVSPLVFEIWSELTGTSLDGREGRFAESRPEAIELTILLKRHGSEWLWRIGKSCVEDDREHGSVLRFARWLDAALESDRRPGSHPAQ